MKMAIRKERGTVGVKAKNLNLKRLIKQTKKVETIKLLIQMILIQKLQRASLINLHLLKRKKKLEKRKRRRIKRRKKSLLNQRKMINPQNPLRLLRKKQVSQTVKRTQKMNQETIQMTVKRAIFKLKNQ